jgi:hypothetical protein
MPLLYAKPALNERLTEVVFSIVPPAYDIKQDASNAATISNDFILFMIINYMSIFNKFQLQINMIIGVLTRDKNMKKQTEYFMCPPPRGIRSYECTMRSGHNIKRLNDKRVFFTLKQG